MRAFSSGATGSRATPTSKSSCIYTRSRVTNAFVSWSECLHSQSGTPAAVACCLHGIGLAKSRCITHARQMVSRSRRRFPRC